MTDGMKDPGSIPGPRTTDFEAQTHDALLAMIKGANSESAAELAQRLSKASSVITRVGEGMKAHMTRVVWQGEGGESFRDWGHKAVMATLELGGYTQKAADVFEEVATALAHAKAAVPPRDGAAEAREESARELLHAARKDPGSGNAEVDALKMLTGAQTAQEHRRLEAADQLRKLGQTYTHSGQRIQSMPLPEFPPPPGEFMPPEGSRIDGGRNVGEMNGAGASSSLRAAPALTSETELGSAGSSSGASSAPRTGSPAERLVEAPSVSTRLDSVGTLPPPTTAGPGPAPTPSPSPVRSEGFPPLLGGAPPLTAGPVGGPTQGRAAASGRSLPGTGQLYGGTGRPTGGTPGIVGGRPMPPAPGRAAGGIPRGLVVGGEQQAMGRAPLGQGAAGAGGRAAASPAATGTGGRRVAGETGGVMGGRPSQPGAAVGRTAGATGTGPSRSSSTGNARPSVGAGGVPPQGRKNERTEERDKRKRPDYLTEDEETWLSDNRRVVPPVID
ncbi:hypothetical protein [Streptomyces sp. NPDC090026]|uniref:hypothetical protein n=1 Tax=Streptomyces sp. NPDC090026 TaxID=3365923 RepID=UPI0037FD2A8F